MKLFARPAHIFSAPFALPVPPWPNYHQNDGLGKN